MSTYKDLVLSQNPPAQRYVDPDTNEDTGAPGNLVQPGLEGDNAFQTFRYSVAATNNNNAYRIVASWWMKIDMDVVGTLTGSYGIAGGVYYRYYYPDTFNHQQYGNLRFTNGVPTLESRTRTIADTWSSVYRDLPTDGQWHHYAMVDNVLYIDGVNSGSFPLSNVAVKSVWHGPGAPIPGVEFDCVSLYRVLQSGAVPGPGVIASQANFTWGTPAVFETAPATADAFAIDPTVEAIVSPHVNVSADPATATAMPGEASVSVQGHLSYSPSAATANSEMLTPAWGFRESTVFRRLATEIVPRSTASRTPGSTIGKSEYSYARAVYAIKVPVDEWSDSDIASVTLEMRYTTKNDANDSRLAAWVVDSPDGSITPNNVFWSGYPKMNSTAFLDVPVGAKWIMFGNYDGNGRTVWDYDNPAVDSTGYDSSAFKIEVMGEVVNNVTVNAEASTLYGEMANADAYVQMGVSIGAIAATANAQMPGGYFPDFTFTALPAGATATMGAAWFKSDRRVYVEGAAEALGEALDVADVYAGREIIFPTSASTASGFARDPEAVNGQEINNDLHDPYWNRIMRLSTEGSLPPAPGAWYRFNERSGGKVYAANAAGQRAAAFDLTGVFEQGVPGINGRNALRVSNAGIVIADDIVHNQGGLIPFGASLEFSIRIEPGHTGRMDIANGQEREGMTSWVVRRLHVSVRDGRIYASSRYGGTTTRRIDDGQWHHIVFTTEPNTSGAGHSQSDIDLQFYIDGKLDRTLASEENTGSGGSDPRGMARPTKFFGQDTGYPFRGEIMEVVFRNRYLQSHEVMELYLDLFGYKAVRATPATGEATITKDNRVVSNMKRMLVLTWAEPYTSQDNTPNYMRGLAPKYERSLYAHRYGSRGLAAPNEDVPQLSPMLGYGYDEEMDIGRYQLIYQDVSVVDTATNEEARRKYAQGTTDEHPLKFSRFRDDVTGEYRFVNLQTDIDLDDYEVIAFQAYPNPSYKDQAERLKYEAFFNSVNTALADGHKIWITDAYLAADLGWVSRVDTVPVLNQEINGRVANRGRRGLDVRGYEVFPFDESVGGAKEGITPVTKPADGSMPELPKGQPGGSQRGFTDVWDFDVHQNNGYRVVNEIAGLTDLPSWELVEMGARERMRIFNDGTEHGRWAYRMENRTGEDFTWERQYTDNSPTGGGKPVGEKYEFTKPAKGRGLKAGDEFYDYTWFDRGNDYFTYAGSASYATAEYALLRRVGRTWAVPFGALRIGTPVTTFRSTQWNDFGDEIVNPWRNHIRNAVVRPGDRLPDGRKVKGYAYMEFAEHPIWDELAGIGVQKQLTFGVGMNPSYNSSSVPNTSSTLAAETEYTFDWDYVRGIGRSTFGAAGQTQEGVKVTVSYTTGAGGQVVPTFTQTVTESLPIAQKVRSFHPTAPVPHITWNARGLSWLTLVDTVDAEFSNTAASVATGQGSMLEASVSTEFDNTVSVGAAQAVGNIVAPEEAQVKEANVQAFAATASAMMNGLQGGYKAEAAIGYADMFQGVKRPLDIEEVLFFTLSMNQETIYVRMEEN